MPRPFHNLTRHLAQLIAPPVCALCGGAGQWLDEPWGLDLCLHCHAACRRVPPPPEQETRAFCLFRYEEPVDLMIQQLKFHGALVHARVLGTLLAHAVRASGRPVPECIVPMPLHASRLRQRGFCQTTEIGRHVARRLRTAAGSRPQLRRDFLRRTRATRAQSSLDLAERARNLQGAFACRPGTRPPRHVALLDDVLTTGNTARAAVAALRAGGVGRVEIWCCARALRHDQTPTDFPGRPDPWT